MAKGKPYLRAQSVSVGDLCTNPLSDKDTELLSVHCINQTQTLLYTRQTAVASFQDIKSAIYSSTPAGTQQRSMTASFCSPFLCRKSAQACPFPLLLLIAQGIAGSVRAFTGLTTLVGRLRLLSPLLSFPFSGFSQFAIKEKGPDTAEQG